LYTKVRSRYSIACKITTYNPRNQTMLKNRNMYNGNVKTRGSV
jgi:hypothetical protein